MASLPDRPATYSFTKLSRGPGRILRFPRDLTLPGPHRHISPCGPDTLALSKPPTHFVDQDTTYLTFLEVAEAREKMLHPPQDTPKERRLPWNPTDWHDPGPTPQRLPIGIRIPENNRGLDGTRYQHQFRYDPHFQDTNTPQSLSDLWTAGCGRRSQWTADHMNTHPLVISPTSPWHPQWSCPSCTFYIAGEECCSVLQGVAMAIVKWHEPIISPYRVETQRQILAYPGPNYLLSVLKERTPHFQKNRTAHDHAFYQSTKFLEVLREGTVHKFTTCPQLKGFRDSMAWYATYTCSTTREPVWTSFHPSKSTFNASLWAGDMGSDYCDDDPWGLVLECAAARIRMWMKIRMIPIPTPLRSR